MVSVPAANLSRGQLARDVAAFIRSCHGKLLVITGAGVSTPSNIPDYRGPKGAYVVNKDYKPIQYQEFMGRHYNRQRYWARSMLGYGTIFHAQPNTIHHSLAEIEAKGHLVGVVTQNVDSLHHKAGGRNVIELHGTLARVECQSCGHAIPRDEFQAMLKSLNPTWVQHIRRDVTREEERVKTVIPPSHTSPGETGSVRPDGDMDVALDFAQFTYPPCHKCGNEATVDVTMATVSVKSVLKPAVVFFGENIPPKVKEQAAELVGKASGGLVLGSTLTTYSAYRLVRDLHAAGKPVWCINKGPTRADALLTRKIEAPIQEIMADVAEML
ncbi:hypothetical protein AMAG_13638 [Allomyces macrogynus ATCC 38327]|uniref:Deacetylase sirtuin-type domain-containing protein n=2 Tax=Allomyces macrogynus (strain ATCC 38327) TaxID=578462 RepID=A0A0L0T317_ALLM3|nr:hypothetical protein AMAG_13638 [Allomyces macrogynus ATCC 38327]|eukprot:KNE69253.1 hypothetical protein AMAG_13638 [Allomyces macrogynus ATCC 38327]